MATLEDTTSSGCATQPQFSLPDQQSGLNVVQNLSTRCKHMADESKGGGVVQKDNDSSICLQIFIKGAESWLLHTKIR